MRVNRRQERLGWSIAVANKKAGMRWSSGILRFKRVNTVLDTLDFVKLSLVQASYVNNVCTLLDQSISTDVTLMPVNVQICANIDAKVLYKEFNTLLWHREM
ncbi:hypothetical protein BaRGS_00018653 [Batillaria attramentaria]|uniref:Uncharacterized protein n=1 Tax=Batillaria attramentaria TaxID=370345 RepID=A0ABD0KSV2_9CAEN